LLDVTDGAGIINFAHLYHTHPGGSLTFMCDIQFPVNPYYDFSSAITSIRVDANEIYAYIDYPNPTTLAPESGTIADHRFTGSLRSLFCSGQQIDRGRDYRGSMNTALLHARRMSLALLVVAVVEHGNASIDCSGASPNSSGLVRLGRDLLRQSGGSCDRVGVDENARVRGTARPARWRWPLLVT
jgi:hypothetical protein